MRLYDLESYGLTLAFCHGRRGELVVWNEIEYGTYKYRNDVLTFCPDGCEGVGLVIESWAMGGKVYVDVLDLFGEEE